MKTNLLRTFLATGALAASGIALAEPPVRVHTEGLPMHMRVQVEAAAQQGATSLRQYLQRTRMLGYNLRVEEVAVDSDLVGVAKQAVAKSPKVEKVVATR
jgi:hypothetical protein